MMWSYSFRAQHVFGDSDDSGTENDAISPLQPTETTSLSDDGQFFKDLDLSLREDNAQYKPNPWSIAKINAASRNTHPGTCGVPSIRLTPCRDDSHKHEVQLNAQRRPDLAKMDPKMDTRAQVAASSSRTHDSSVRNGHQPSLEPASLTLVTSPQLVSSQIHATTAQDARRQVVLESSCSHQLLSKLSFFSC